MKKTTKIISLTLIVAALLTSACGCNSEHIHTNPSDQTKESIPVGGSGNTHIESVDTSKLTFAKTCDNVDFYYDENNQWYAYIDSWGTYRKLGKIADGIDDAWLGENTVEIITSQARRGKNLVITTLKLTRDSEEIARNSFELDMEYEEGNRLFCNYYQENCAYFFCTLQYESHQLIRFETTDGGKTWVNEEIEPEVHAKGGFHDWPEITKFVSKEVGIVNYRNICGDPFYECTYVTTDSGKTWTNFPGVEIDHLDWPFGEKQAFDHVTVQNFKKIDDEYILTVTTWINDSLTTCELSSMDLTSWTYVKSW